MAETPGSTHQEEKRGSLNGLLFWLGLLPVILGSLFCCAQLALFAVPRGDWSADTTSRLSASYLPWEYKLIPPLRLAALIEDLERDARLEGTPKAVVTAIYWVPPTPTPTTFGVVNGTGTPVAMVTPTRTPDLPNGTPTTRPTNILSATPTQRVSPTSTFTRQPTATTIPPTATRTPIPAATRTFTPEPRETDTPFIPSNTPVPTTAVPPTAVPATPVPPTPVTPSVTPVTPPPTVVVPTETPVTPPPTASVPTVTPTYAPVWPIAENDGVSVPYEAGCRASFGYRNDNPVVVNIPVGLLNQISDDTADISPFQPTEFLRDRVTGAFDVYWTSGNPIIWSLDGQLATAQWCGVPVSP